jgi:hypothetical protein
MEELVKHERHSKHIANVVIHASDVAGQGRAIRHHTVDSVDIKSADAASTLGETNVWRQARQMRQEWRQCRYSRLK